MAKEIERKYLVTDNSYRIMAREVVAIAQGYLSRRKEATVRVRLKGDCAYLTVKGPNEGAERSEWEYAIPVADAREMLTPGHCEGCIIAKDRYLVDFRGHCWEVDEFKGHLQGLVVAEIELENADEAFVLPPFVGVEVTNDPRYYNSNLAECDCPPK